PVPTPYQFRTRTVLFGEGRCHKENESLSRAANRSLMQTRWRIELLGRFRACWGEHELSRFPRQKAADLLAYLACARGRSASREALIEILWPEIDPELGRNNLRKLLHTLRQ